jgi:phosphoesterase RecJ-like protein
VVLKNFQGISNLKEKLSSKPKILITTHVNPDGDAIGSLLGLYLFFKKQGYQVSAITPNEYPESLQWMHCNGDVVDYTGKKGKAQKIISEADIIFHLDYNDLRRSGDMAEDLSNANAYKVMIDHHPYPQLKVDISISVIEVSSTAELIFEFICAMDSCSVIDNEVAECIYTGIMTDTGCFSFNSSRTRTFEIVANLLSMGIRKDEIFRLVYDNFSASRMRLLGYCLNEKMQVYPEYRTAFISISQEEQKKYEFAVGDSEGFVNYPLSIKGICFSALFIEKKDKIRVSFRSRGSFPVNALAEKYFSGGGHLNASGGESKLTLDQTIQKLIDILPEYKEMLNS